MQPVTNTNNPAMARRVADAVKAFELEAEGCLVRDITVVLVNRSLILIFERGLSSLERSLAQSAAGAAHVEEFHQHLFTNPQGRLWREIHQITRDGAPFETDEESDACHSCVKVFTNGTVVHVCQLSQNVETSVWSEQRVSAPAPV